MITRSHLFFGLIIAVLIIAPDNVVLASETNGTIITGGNTGYAWSDKTGWLNFGLTGGEIHMTDSAFTGYAWSGNSGWVNLSPANSGVTNNGEGTLSGYAWGAGLGWINFSGVTVDSSGRFHGTASGALIGTLTFDCDHCDVRTDWRPLSARSAVSSATTGGGGGGISTPAILPLPTSPSELTPAQAKDLDPVKDGAFNIFDFNAMIVNWEKQEPGNPADINSDGLVDIFDFNLLMVYWGVTYQI